MFNSNETKILQPDGSTFQGRLRGDEWNNWVETADGFSIAKDQEGYWRYISGFNGETPILDSTLAGVSPPKGLKKHIHKASISSPQSLPDTPSNFAFLNPNPPIGNFSGPVLIILAEFTDRAGTYPYSDWVDLTTNKIPDYFNKASYGKVNLTPAIENYGPANDGVIGWLNLGFPHPDPQNATDSGNRKIVKKALEEAEPFIDYASYDANSDGFIDAHELAIVVIAAGFEKAFGLNFSPRVPAHQSALYGLYGPPTFNGVEVGGDHGGDGGYALFGEIHGDHTPQNTHQATMGVMVHELGHLIWGLPDLYDTDSKTSGKASSGIGVWGVMGNGDKGRIAGQKLGETPVLPSAWTKFKLGWVDANEYVGYQSVTAAGHPSANSANTVIKSSTTNPDQYFLTENRQPIGYDMGFTGMAGTGGVQGVTISPNFGGLAIWHIDESQTNNNDNFNRLVDLEEADGTEMGTTQGEDTDLWYQGNATQFNDTTNPDTKLNDGTSTDVFVSNVSASGMEMTVNYGGILNGAKLYGLTFPPSLPNDGSLEVIDPVTGSATQQALIPGVNSIWFRNLTLDEKNNVFYFIGPSSTTTADKLIGIDIDTGQVLTDLVVPPDGWFGLEFNSQKEELYAITETGISPNRNITLVKIDPLTGNQAAIAILNSDYETFSESNTTLDEVKNIYYYIGEIFDSNLSTTKYHLIGVDLDTGQVVSQPEVAHDSVFPGLEFNSRKGELYASINNGGFPVQNDVVKITPATGAQTVIATIPNVSNINPKIRTLDVFHNIYYFLGIDSSSNFDQRLIGVDMDSGQIITNPITSSSAWYGLAFRPGADFDPPVITLLGNNPENVDTGTVYSDAGATAQDNVDGPVVVNSSGHLISTVTPGIYTVTYTATDAAGNTSTATRTVNVGDPDLSVTPVDDLNASGPQGGPFVPMSKTYTLQNTGSAPLSFALNPVSAPDWFTISPNFSAVANWVDATVGTNTGLVGVDEAVDIPIGFNFNFNGIEFSSVKVSTNGYLTFESDGLEYINQLIPDPASPNAVIAPFWDDLETGTGAIFYLLEGVAPNRKLTIEWNNVQSYDFGGAATFEATLFEGSNEIVFRYQDVVFGDPTVDQGASATVGVEYQGGTSGILYSFDTASLVAGTAILFNQTTNSFSESSSTELPPGASTTVQVTLTGNANSLITGIYSDTINFLNLTSGVWAAARAINLSVSDSTSPVITVNGNNPETVPVGATYTDAGATAIDTVDGPVPVTTSGLPIDTSMPGTHTVTYMATNSAGNSSTATRTVNVVDTTPPVITMNGNNPETVSVGATYTDAGATAVDDVDGPVTPVVSGLPIDTSTPGTHTVTYTATDNAGNSSTATRTVNVVDTTPPVITMNGNNPETVEAGTPYVDAGATAIDNVDGDLTLSVVTTGLPIDTSVPGSHQVTYNVSDNAGNAATPVIRTVNVVDTTPPVITMNGNNPETVSVGAFYVDAGATANDNIDGVVTVVSTGLPIDTSSPGVFQVNYSATDSSGNNSVAVRTVNVVDTTPPVISVLGNNPETVNVGEAYNDAGATAIDNVDGIILVTTTGLPIDTSVPGTHTVTYEATDNAGNLGTATRTVNVIAVVVPVVRNDFDGDGDSDLLAVSDDGTIVSALQENSVFQSFGTLLTANPGQGWTVNSTGDVNGDQKADILLYNTTTGEYRVVTVDGTTVLTDSVVLVLDPLIGIEPRGLADFDGDGEAEIILYIPANGTIGLVYLTGGVFDHLDVVTTVDEANNWTLRDYADFTNDGKTDFLITNTVTGETSVIEMNGSTAVGTTPIFTLAPALGLPLVDTGDLTGDGNTDILSLHTSNALVSLVMNGLTFQNLLVPGGLAAGWELVNAGLYDGDDIADFLISVPATGEVITGIHDGVAITGFNTVLNLGPGSGWSFHKGKP